jgi:multidrug efflux pump subunit AcrB
VVQNASPPDLVGTATAANSFFREIGVCLGSAVVGALFTARLVLPAQATALTPEATRALSPELQAAVAAAYDAALTPVFAVLVPVVLLATVALLVLREQPLATTVADAPDAAGTGTGAQAAGLAEEPGGPGGPVSAR